MQPYTLCWNRQWYIQSYDCFFRFNGIVSWETSNTARKSFIFCLASLHETNNFSSLDSIIMEKRDCFQCCLWFWYVNSFDRQCFPSHKISSTVIHGIWLPRLNRKRDQIAWVCKFVCALSSFHDVQLFQRVVIFDKCSMLISFRCASSSSLIFVETHTHIFKLRTFLETLIEIKLACNTVAKAHKRSTHSCIQLVLQTRVTSFAYQSTCNFLWAF